MLHSSLYPSPCLSIPQSLALPPQHAVMKVKRQHHALQMGHSRQDNEHMEDLVRAAPDVKGTGVLDLGEADLSPCQQSPSTNVGLSEGATHRIQKRAANIQHALQNDPAEPHALIETPVAVHGESMQDGDDARQAEPNKHQRAVRPPRRGAEVLEPRNNKAAEAEEDDLFWSAHHPPKHHHPPTNRGRERERLTAPKYPANSPGEQKNPYHNAGT